MKQDLKNLIKEIKNNNQDFEFYPTKKSMIQTIVNDYIKEETSEYNKRLSNFSLLDIGAGNGNVFNLFNDAIFELNNIEEENRKTVINKYAIEKSEILINNLASDVMVVGTDFNNQTLIDKKVDVIFCNPPYKQYKEWMLKIIQEANCNYIYLIVPERWKNDKSILKAINQRLDRKDINFTELELNIEDISDRLKVIGNDTFEDSEYRQARANIDIIKIKVEHKYYKNDPFDLWFHNNFKINANQSEEFQTTEEKRQHIKKSLVKGKNLIESLEELYLKDFEKLLNTYKALENIDGALFKEMGINLGILKTNLKTKIKNLKILYWEELFNNLNKITDKLTSNSRKKLLNTLTANTSIDFTASNAYSLLIWVLKNANKYLDEQLKDVYYDMASKENIINYKSNKRLLTDDYRYRSGLYSRKITHFKLDYRLIFSRFHCWSVYNYSSYDCPNGLKTDVHDFLKDISTVGHNLGFNVITSSLEFQWEAGKENVFYFLDKNNKKIEFMKIRIYKNGNIHCKPNQEFIKALNIEMARLNRWLKDETEIAKELDLTLKDVAKYFKSNKQLLNYDIKFLDYN